MYNGLKKFLAKLSILIISTSLATCNNGKLIPKLVIKNKIKLCLIIFHSKNIRATGKKPKKSFIKVVKKLQSLLEAS